MAHSSRNIEDGALGDLNYEGPNQEVSKGKNNNSWSRDNSCHILAKNVATFCHCPKNMAEANRKKTGRGNLRQPRFDCVMWL